MPKIPVKDVLNLIFDLQHQQEAQQQQIASPDQDSQLALLRDWQSRRLRRTYADLLVSKKYRQGCEFFLSDIYASRDFSQRDHDAERLYEILSSYLPENTLDLVAKSIRINQLTNSLDHDLLHVLVNQLGVKDSITPALYAEGYRLCDNYDERKYQIEQLVEILLEVGKTARNPLIGVVSKLARIPAHRAGWVEIYDFLERGYTALRRMRNVKYFVAIIEHRETLILERIFESHPEPFNI